MLGGINLLGLSCRPRRPMHAPPPSTCTCNKVVSSCGLMLSVCHGRGAPLSQMEYILYSGHDSLTIGN